jgi:hypothetical protein
MRRSEPFLVILLVCLGCASPPRAPAGSHHRASTTSTSSSVPPPTHPRAWSGYREVLTTTGTHLGVISDDALALGWKPAAAANTWSTPFWGPKHRGTLELVVGGSMPAPTTRTRSTILVNELTLHVPAVGAGHGGSTAAAPKLAEVARLSCVEVDVLGKHDNGHDVRVFLPANAGTFEGIAINTPKQIAWGNCPTRATRSSPFPDFWKLADPTAAGRVRLSGAIWWNDGQGCKEWLFHRDAGFLQLRHIERVTSQGGTAESVTNYNFEEADYLSMYAPSTTSRWIREPVGLHRGLTDPGPLGIVWSIAFVQADADSVRWVVAGPGVIAYHPDEEVTWFLNRRSCVASTKPG